MPSRHSACTGLVPGQRACLALRLGTAVGPARVLACGATDLGLPQQAGSGVRCAVCQGTYSVTIASFVNPGLLFCFVVGSVKDEMLAANCAALAPLPPKHF